MSPKRLLRFRSFLGVCCVVAWVTLAVWRAECFAAVAEDESKVRIEGQVVDEAGTPVKGAVVSVVGSKAELGDTAVRSGADGHFLLEQERQPVLRYETLLASADGGARQGLYRFDGDSQIAAKAMVRIVVKPCHRVTVRAADATGRP